MFTKLLHPNPIARGIMIPLDERQLHDFQTAFNWKTGYDLPDGRLLGVEGKRGKVDRGLDPRVQAVRDRLESADKRVLEIGCCEGGHTVQLARVAREVVGLDVRAHNVIGTLTRLFVNDVRNARVGLKDVRDLGDEYGSFDIVFHVGVLYHLDDPADHLARVAALAPDLILDTHYGDESLPWPSETLRLRDKTYLAKVYREGGWDDVFSGVQPTSNWVMKADLMRLLHDVGFDKVELLDDRKERNGPRLTLIARQTRRADAKPGAPLPNDAAGWEARARALEAELAEVKASWPYRFASKLRGRRRAA